MREAAQLHALVHKGESEAPFQTNRGWLWHFCQCHGIQQLSLQGEKVSFDVSAVEPFKEDLKELIECEQLALEQLYNCDETGLYYRLLPEASLREVSFWHEKDEGACNINDVLECKWDAQDAFSGHRQVCKSRCFKNVNKRALPVHYCSQKSAWMECKIFSD